jgi:cyclophilin family peptidyl-prolyl cis-trans isomerase
MNTFVKRFFLLNILWLFISCAAPGGNENSLVQMKTSMGDIKLRLYDETPAHRDNFIKLVNSGFYKGVSFHRVIRDFMIQAGDPGTKANKEELHDSLSTYTIPAEFRSQYYHKKGALAAARQGNDVNPEMRSSGTQFYIVHGTRMTDSDIDDMQQRMNSVMKQNVFNNFLSEVADSSNKSGNPLSAAEIQEIASIKMFNYLNNYKDFEIPGDHREVYKTVGGVPRLDGTYTVFGEVIEGMDIVDKIASVQTDATDKPFSDVKILDIKIVRE